MRTAGSGLKPTLRMTRGTGLSIEWDENGKKVYEANYKDGELVE